MNRFKYSVIAFALVGLTALSCAKKAEEEVPDVRPEPTSSSIQAYIVQAPESDATKTDYTIDDENKRAFFTWVDGDHIDATVAKGDVLSYVVFTKQADTQEQENVFIDGQLQGQPTLSERAGYALSGWAFYPSRVSPEALNGGYIADWSFESGAFKLDLPVSFIRPNAKPLATIPMVGRTDAEGKYAFTQPVGVLAVTVKNLPMEADFISIHSETAALAGSFGMVGETPYIAARQAAADVEKTVVQHFSGLEGEHTFYFAVPVGDIPAGLVLTVGSSSNPDLQMSRQTTKALTIPRGNIVKTYPLVFEPVDQQWAECGTATFKDDFLWKNNSAFTSVTSVTVTLERSGLNPNKYRINNPYVVASAQVEYTPIDPDPYFVFLIGENGAISYTDCRTGLEDTNGYPMKLVMSGSSRVVSSQKTGDFYELVFSSRYSLYTPDAGPSGEYWTKSDVIHLMANVEETFTKVLDGTFIDEKMWGLHEWGSERVNIELYASDQITGHYRVPNPYLVAKDHFNYTTYVEGITGDDYLDFTVESGDAVRFVTFQAGIEDRASGGFALRVFYPSDYGTYSTALAGNHVASYRSDDLPAEVELYPIYVDVAAGTGETGNKYTDQGAMRVRMSFPEAETWTAVSTLDYKDDFIFNVLKGKPVDSHVSVTLEQSNVNPKRFRMANPYPALCDALGVQKYTDGISEYFVMTVDDEDKITYEEFRPGVGDSSVELMICEPAEWNSKRIGGWDAYVGNSRVISYDANGIPVYVKLYGIYHEVGNYIGPGQTGNHMYTRDGGSADIMVLAASLPVDGSDSWTSIGTGRFKDKLVWECAGLTDYAEVEFQQNVNYPNKFRIARPYPGEGSDAWFMFDVTDPDDVVSTKYYLDYEVTASGKASYKPYIWTEYYSNDYCKVLSTQANGMPAVVELGVCYRFEPWSSYDYSYDYEIGRDHEMLAIEIIFPGCDPYLSLSVTPYQTPVLSNFHLPVARLTIPLNGTLERVVVKINGGDYSKMAGLRLYGPNGWMDSDYVAPDADGVVTMTTFTNASVTGGIDLNFWLNDNSQIGQSISFDIQEFVVSGHSYNIVQDKDFSHFPGIRVNHGGDKVTVRGFGGLAEETVNFFRIPALVTSNAGTLIAAYDVRYDGSADLTADIDVGVKRSTDGGKTWSDLVLAMDMDTYGYDVTDAEGWKEAQRNNGIGDPCLLVDENTGRIFCFAVWGHGHRHDPDIRCLAWADKGFDIDKTPQLMMVYSDDDGITWSDPVNLTQQIKNYDWRMTFQGPGRGITMKNGTLVIPIQHQEGETKNMHSLYPLNSGIAYSTDHGETWHAHNFAYPITSESAVAEIEPGVLLLTMRDETDSHTRRNYVTTDMGRTWTKHASDGLLIDSTCEASLLHVDAADNVLGKDLLLFSNPKNAAGRSNYHIQASEDGGVTWTHSLQIDAGGALGYTCLTMVDSATVGILYESSRGHILFQAIPLTDIVK